MQARISNLIPSRQLNSWLVYTSTGAFQSPAWWCALQGALEEATRDKEQLRQELTLRHAAPSSERAGPSVDTSQEHVMLLDSSAASSALQIASQVHAPSRF